MYETIDSSIGIANKTVSLIDTLIVKIEKYQKLRQDTTTYLRLLYLEVINNLEVFNTIDIAKFNNIKAGDPKLKLFLKLIHTEISESVFFKSSDNLNADLYEKLKKKGKVIDSVNKSIKTASNTAKSTNNSKIAYENILQALSFVVTKVEIIKKYSNLEENETDILIAMKFNERLKNIKNRLNLIKKIMDDFDEIKEMAR